MEIQLPDKRIVFGNPIWMFRRGSMSYFLPYSYLWKSEENRRERPVRGKNR